MRAHHCIYFVHALTEKRRAEKASIDEAFIDFTIPVREEIFKRYPYLAEVPTDAPLGKDTPLPPPPPIIWDGLGTVIPVNPPPKVDGPDDRPDEEADPQDEAASVMEETGEDTEENAIEQDDSSATWHDVALSIAAELMGKIRRDIFAQLGYSTSAVSAVRLELRADVNSSC